MNLSIDFRVSGRLGAATSGVAPSEIRFINRYLIATFTSYRNHCGKTFDCMDYRLISIAWNRHSTFCSLMFILLDYCTTHLCTTNAYSLLPQCDPTVHFVACNCCALALTVLQHSSACEWGNRCFRM